MSLENTLRGRWKPQYDKRGSAAALRKHFDGALAAREALEAQKGTLAKDGRLSELGRMQNLQAFAAKQAPTLAKASRAVATARKKLDERRAALVPTVKDKTDVANALLRMEIRATLRGKPPGELAGILFSESTPSIVIEAIWEAPQFLHGVPAEMKSKLLDVLLERNHSPEIAAFNEEGEAIDLAAEAVRAGMNSLVVASGLKNQHFDKWLAEAAPVDPKEQAREVRDFEVERLIKEAAALPFDDRMKVSGTLLDISTEEAKAS